MRSVFCLRIFQHSKFPNDEQGNVICCDPRCHIGDGFWLTIFFEFDRPELYEGVSVELRKEQMELELCGKTMWFKDYNASE